jgi:hypothetical protein
VHFDVHYYDGQLKEEIIDLGLYLAWETSEMLTKFWCGTLRGRDRDIDEIKALN